MFIILTVILIIDDITHQEVMCEKEVPYNYHVNFDLF